MAAVHIIIILILLGVIGVLSYLVLKTKRPIIGKAVIPPTVQESHIMEMLGQSNAKVDELKKVLSKQFKEREAKININEEIKRKTIIEKKKTIMGGVPLILVTKEKYKIIGYDGSDYGILKAFIVSTNGERMWVYYQKGEIVDIIGGKQMSEIIKSIDKKLKMVFIQYNKNKKLIPKRYVEV